MKTKSNFLFLFFTILLVSPAIVGVLHKGFFLSDDGNWMVIRFSAFYEALRGGQFPVRFLPRLNNGYGYPVADFLYPLFMYIGVPIHVLGFNFVNTIKIIFALGLISSSIFCFLWLRKTFGNLSSLVGSVLYCLFPYHLWDMYKRGSVGEVLALAIVPFTAWAIEMENLPLAGLGYGLLILAHNSLALLFIPILFIYQLFKTNGSKAIKSLKAVEIGLMLSCFFWLPALYDKQFTVFDKTNVSDFIRYFVSDYSLLGLVTITGLLGSLIFIRNKNKKFIYFFALTLVALFLSTSKSTIIWQNFPFISLIQFPFRILSLVILSVSYLVAYQINSLKGRSKIGASLIYIVLIFVSAWPFLFPKNYQYYPDTFFSTNQDSTTVRNEYMPKWVLKIPTSKAAQKVEVVKGKALISNLSEKGTSVNFDVSSTEKITIAVNTVYFPGWQVNVDGRSIPISYENENGLIRFNVGPSNHTVKVGFYETPLRLFSDLVSTFGLFLILFLFLKKTRFIKI